MAAPLSKKLTSVQNPKRLAGTWIYTLLWCAISFSIFAVFAFWQRDLAVAVAGGFVSVLGLGMLYASLQETLEYLKYRQVRLVLARPPETGGKLEAALDLPAAVPADGHLFAELACLRLKWWRDHKENERFGEWDVWTGQQPLTVRRGPLASHATIAISIPADQPASSLPGERAPDTMFRASLSSRAVQLDREYYRWELRIRADVPGIDLDRIYPLQVAAGPTAAPARPAGTGAALHSIPALDASFVVHALGKLWLRFRTPTLGGTLGLGVAGLIGAGFLMAHLYNAGKLDLGGLDGPLRAALNIPPASMQIAEFEVQPNKPSYIGIAARGISAETRDGEFRVRVEEIRLEKIPGPRPAEYDGIGAVVSRVGDWPETSFGYSWQAAKGTLTVESPAINLRDRIFTFPGVLSRCEGSACEVRLLAVVRPDAGSTQREDTHPARLRTGIAH